MFPEVVAWVGCANFEGCSNPCFQFCLRCREVVIFNAQYSSSPRHGQNFKTDHLQHGEIESFDLRDLDVSESSWNLGSDCLKNNYIASNIGLQSQDFRCEKQLNNLDPRRGIVAHYGDKLGLLVLSDGDSALLVTAQLHILLASNLGKQGLGSQSPPHRVSSPQTIIFQ